jgi:hypothetical protein
MDDDAGGGGPDGADVALTRARTGAALWPAIEAAQYARLVDFEPPRSDEERAAVDAFLDAFGRCAEDWEAVPDQNKTALFTALDGHLGVLARIGLHVHAGTTNRDFELDDGPVALPVAILRVGHDADDVVHVRMPDIPRGMG